MVDRILTCPRISISNVYTQLLPAIQSYTNLYAAGKRCCSCNQDLTQLTVRKGYYPGWTLNQGSPYQRMGLFLAKGIQRERDSMHEKFSIAGFEEEGYMARNGAASKCRESPPADSQQRNRDSALQPQRSAFCQQAE